MHGFITSYTYSYIGSTLFYRFITVSFVYDSFVHFLQFHVFRTFITVSYGYHFTYLHLLSFPSPLHTSRYYPTHTFRPFIQILFSDELLIELVVMPMRNVNLPVALYTKPNGKEEDNFAVVELSSILLECL